MARPTPSIIDDDAESSIPSTLESDLFRRVSILPFIVQQRRKRKLTVVDTWAHARKPMNDEPERGPKTNQIICTAPTVSIVDGIRRLCPPRVTA